MNDVRTAISIDETRPLADLVSSLKNQPSLKFLAEFQSLEDALDNLGRLIPDLVMLDTNFSEVSKIDSINQVIDQSPQSKLFILTESVNEDDVRQAIRSGATGYFTKSCCHSLVLQALHVVAEGGTSFAPQLTPIVTQSLSETGSNQSPIIPNILTKREIEILKLISDGIVQKEIANQLDLSSHTVVEYIKHIYQKLNVPNAPSAVAKAIKLNLIP